VDQALFDIPAALEHSQRAAELAPENALTQARLAEVWLMTGDTDAAREAATQATSLDPELSLGHTVLGFASLRGVKPHRGESAFLRAVALDSSAPLPRLGLGLLKIREGDLLIGREEIETAVLLDPSNALLRSYMGKAYYEEKRNALASNQFALAKALDPNDPTAWFYDSILLQSDNRPVEALRAQQQAIRLNDNRGVYRSRQLLDKDEASRSVVLGRLYRDLGFEQLVASEGAESLNLDPTNYSAHRLLSDAYAGLSRYEVARSSELLQAQMLQPSNQIPIQPQLAETSLTAIESTGLGGVSYNEYSSLYARNRLSLQGNALIASDDTFGDEIIVSGLHDRFSFSLGQYHYKTDGFRENSDIDYDLYNLFGQYMLTPDLTIQGEYKYLDTTFGDLEFYFNPEDFSPLEENEWKKQTSRLGLTYHSSPETTYIINALHANFERDYFDNILYIDELGIFVDSVNTKNYDQNGYSFEALVIHEIDEWNATAGISHIDIDIDEQTSSRDYNTFPPEFADIPGFDKPTGVPVSLFANYPELERRSDYINLFAYTTWNPNSTVSTTLAGSYIEYDDGLVKLDEFNPKVGLTLSLPFRIRIRAAYFESIVRPFILRQTLEPTHINGFNQQFDDTDGSVTENYGLALEKRFSTTLFSGIELLARDIDSFSRDTDELSTNVSDSDINEDILRAYLLWAPTKRFSFSSEYYYESVEKISAFDDKRLRTHQIPIEVNYFHPGGVFFKFRPTYVKQDFMSDATESGDENFLIVDIETGYRFANKHGAVRLGVKNLFNKSFQFQDSQFGSIDLDIIQYQPERTGYLLLTLTY
jgi:tetratricopeptide (TPR) repeat protein